MRIGDFLFFAPNVSFSELDLDSVNIAELWERRIEGFYLRPCEELAANEHAFAAGLLVLTAIDAISKYEADSTGVKSHMVGVRFKSFVRTVRGFV